MRKIWISIFTLALCSKAWALDTSSKLGIGMSDQLIINLPLISVKYKLDPSSALSGHMGVNSQSDESQYALGVKYYRIIFKEQNLDFYSSLGATAFTYKQQGESKSGHQVDWTFGTEFSFEKLKSLGFSLEFGLSALKYQDKTSIRTTGNNILQAAVHFYL